MVKGHGFRDENLSVTKIEGDNFANLAMMVSNDDSRSGRLETYRAVEVELEM